MIFEEETKKERAHKALVRMGILEKNGGLTKRSWITLLLVGNCYLFILLFSFLLGHFGETAVALMVFAAGILVFRKVSTLQREVTERSKEMDDPERLLREAEKGDAEAARKLLSIALRSKDKPLAIMTTGIIMRHVVEWLGVLRETGAAYETAMQLVRWVKEKETWHIAYPGKRPQCKASVNFEKGQTKPPPNGEALCRDCLWRLEKGLQEFSDTVDKWAACSSPRKRRTQIRDLIISG